MIRYFGLVFAIGVGTAFLMLTLFLYHPEWKATTPYAENLFAGEAINYAYQIAFALIGMASSSPFHERPSLEQPSPLLLQDKAQPRGQKALRDPFGAISRLPSLLPDVE
jgi:hypothetical protein